MLGRVNVWQTAKSNVVSKISEWIDFSHKEENKEEVIFEGENFCEFHESSSIRENFTLEMFLFSGFSTQSVTIHENFAHEKLGRLNSQKFCPSKITRYTVPIIS